MNGSLEKRMIREGGRCVASTWHMANEGGGMMITLCHVGSCGTNDEA